MPSTEITSAIFGRIARRYDLVNRIMSLGQDVRWRAEMFRSVDRSRVRTVLDLCAGTLSCSIAALKDLPDAFVTAIDSCAEMLEVGRRGLDSDQLRRIEIRCDDALTANYPDGSFDLILCGWGLRNVSDPDPFIARAAAMLRPQGRLVIIDCFRPQTLISKGALSILKIMLPIVGNILAHESSPYRYLHDSIQEFMSDDECAKKFADAGLVIAGPRRFSFGLVSIVEGVKSEG